MIRQQYWNAVICVLLCICTWSGYAVPPEMNTLMSTENIKILEIASSKGLEQIWQLRDTPELADVIYLKVPRSQLESVQIDILKAWVRAGRSLWIEEHTLWMNDLATGCVSPLFGFQASTQHFTGQKKLVPLSEHPILSQVEGVMVRSRAGDGVMVYQNSDEALLGTNLEHVAVGMKTLGRGYVVTLPYGMVSHAYDGARFVANLKIWALQHKLTRKIFTSYQGSLGADILYFKNGDSVAVQLMNPSITVDTRFGTMTIPRKHMVSLLFDIGKHGKDIIIMTYGDQLTGTVGTISFSCRILKSETPESIRIIEKNDLVGIDFRSVDPDSDTPANKR